MEQVLNDSGHRPGRGDECPGNIVAAFSGHRQTAAASMSVRGGSLDPLRVLARGVAFGKPVDREGNA
ncbi:hypothetical protein NOF55_17210 [Rhizobiaceae bacterium BDR2-2]|uniref:Uncharacterized protein n=1 Tax=Ectorhizobium quercum TaxID=2965071 RepID=A0AAE3SW00_9HYPH|nr:hypothetical protein [Ectorhizobium quercum]MCX8998855.1 hypothetical protein [Ectorhizobium quercum]